MKSATLNNRISFNNILYIGDEPKACLLMIEKFNNKLSEIEDSHKQWFTNLETNNRFARQYKLQRYIQYHFEGGIAVFKFKNEEELPFSIRKDCLNACKNLAGEQLYYAS